MTAAVIVFWIGVFMIVAGTRFRRTVLGTVGIIIGGVVVFMGVAMASIALAE